MWRIIAFFKNWSRDQVDNMFLIGLMVIGMTAVVMDPNSWKRTVCAVLAVALLGIFILRQKKRVK